ncbi:MAG: 16S rRNA (cytidine(1402)-2'-O)-methyltransferase [Nitrospirota bacterium]
MKGTLYIVSTPIGNLEDITLRALRILKEADLIAAEDTRHSLKLLRHYGIAKQLTSYWGEREKTKSEEIIRILLAGKSVALISDSGTPGISDPGTVLIAKAIGEGIPVVAIPGPSAFLAALSLSGLPADEFTFVGFLPSKKTERLKALEDLKLEKRTLIFYEAPHRITDTLADMTGFFAGRKAVLVKEITKFHEHVFRGLLTDISAELHEATIAGEFVIILEGNTEKYPLSSDDALAEIRALMKKGMGRKEAVKKVAEAYGMRRKELYDRSLL